MWDRNPIWLVLMSKMFGLLFNQYGLMCDYLYSLAMQTTINASILVLCLEGRIFTLPHY